MRRETRWWCTALGSHALYAMQDFRNVHAWQRAHALAVALHKLARTFRRAQYASLRSQLTRAAESIGTNIVEGCGAATPREFARFLDIAIKSANETEHHLLTVRELGLAPYEVWQKHTAETVEIRKMLFGYRRKVLATLTTHVSPLAR